MPRLSTIQKKTEPFRAEICGEKVCGKYRPAVWTASFVDELEKLSDARHGAEMLAQSITEWDLLGDDDKPIALDAETIYQIVPLVIQKAILEAIRRDQEPGNESSGTSRGSFGREAD